MSTATDTKPLKVLIVKPHLPLRVAKRLNDFLHLEPLELEILAAAVPEGDEVRLLDLSVIDKDPAGAYEGLLREYRPDVVALSGYSNQAHLVKQFARTAKKVLPGSLVVVGGIHATIVPLDYNMPEIDVIVRGEGGSVFGGIINRFRSGEKISDGQGILSPKDADFRERAEGDPPGYPEPSSIPKARRDLLDRSKYFSVWTHAPEGRIDTMYPSIASVRTSYGCKFNCGFCVVHYVMGKKYLERTPEDVVNEIASVPEEHIYFVDDETFLNEKRMTEVAELLLERGINKKFVSWARADTIIRRPDLFRLWKKAGLSIVYVGLEAMDEERLLKYNKKTKVDTNRKAVETLREIGITLHAALMVDPDFTIEDFKGVERVVKEISPAEISFTVFSPPPGTGLWDEHRANFICEDPYMFYDCMHTIMPTRLDLNTFYAWFARMYRVAWSSNPLRINKVKAPLREIFRTVVNGIRYVVAIRQINREYSREAQARKTMEPSAAPEPAERA